MTWIANFTDNRTGEDMKHHVSGHDGEAERRCGMAFNPGKHQGTFEVKIACCAAMQTLIRQRDAIKAEHQRRLEESTASEPIDRREIGAFQDSMRGIAHALTLIEDAQMNGVKALHTRANAGLVAD